MDLSIYTLLSSKAGDGVKGLWSCAYNMIYRREVDTAKSKSLSCFLPQSCVLCTFQNISTLFVKVQIMLKFISLDYIRCLAKRLVSKFQLIPTF